MIEASAPKPSPLRVLLAWGVHLLTASGAVIGAAALIAVARGDLTTASVLMLVTLSIDSVDGTLARAVGVSHVVPDLDGRRLDDIVDYFNYAIVPPLFMLAAGLLVHPAWIGAVILSSAYGFSQSQAKTEDHFFLGWPSYWNVVAIQAWLLDVSPAAATAVVAICAILVFVPLRYLYPSHAPVLRNLTNLGGLAWILLAAVASLDPERARSWRLPEILLVYPVYYIALSAWAGDWLGRRRATS